jgi:exopolysaccharide biosynthesis polyprenyl glycosylphosphotransferase
MGERTRELFILILGDAVCFSLALWLTLLLRYLEWPSEERLDAHLGPFLLLSSLWIMVFYIAGLYDKHTVLLKKLLFARIINTQIVNIILAAVVFVMIPFGIAPKTNLVIYLFVSIGLIMFWRLYLFNFFSPKTRHKALLIADGEEAIELADEINNNDRYNYSFVRIIDERAALHMPNFEQKLLELIDREDVEVIVANPGGQHIERVLPAIFDLAFLKFEFTFLDFYKLYEDTFDRIPMSSLRYEWFINHVSQSQSPVYDLLKRVIDIVGAALLFIPALLTYPFIILAIKIEDGGPIFYRTDRVGQFNQPIKMIKFRTMTGRDTGEEALKTKHTVTRVGAVLRRTRLDELPQLWNVLKGDLSFIGPRPEMPALVSVYAESIPYYNMRHFLKPGLSGWAQIQHLDAPRQGIDTEKTLKKLSYDLHYLRCRSFFLDLEIMLKTLRILIMRSGN